MNQDPVNLFEFEALAREKLSQMAYDYFAGGANDEVTLRENRATFDRISLYPYVLRDVSQRDISTTILGQRWEVPYMVAPMGFMGLAHPRSEVALAEGANQVQTGINLSTMSSSSLEDVAQAATVPLWFQLYVYKDRGITRQLVERAQAAGYTALVLTVDTPILGRREKDIRNGWYLPDDVRVANLIGSGMEGIDPDDGHSGLATYIASLWDPSISWDDVDWLHSITELPIILKGILRPNDAIRALQHGAAGVIVSNHGGRQVDTTPAPLDVLPRIRDVVNRDGVVLLDGGIRRGTDIIKALALGADAVMVGRPILWGLSYNGADGVAKVLDILKTELDTSLALCGCSSLDELNPDLLRITPRR